MNFSPSNLFCSFSFEYLNMSLFTLFKWLSTDTRIYLMLEVVSFHFGWKHCGSILNWSLDSLFLFKSLHFRLYYWEYPFYDSFVNLNAGHKFSFWRRFHFCLFIDLELVVALLFSILCVACNSSVHHISSLETIYSRWIGSCDLSVDSLKSVIIFKHLGKSCEVWS